MAMQNTSWSLEDFVDSLVVELDKTRETLAIKAINKPLTYTVKEMAMDLNIFPTYDGDKVTFVTAQPGQQGASKVTIQLGSITDQQVRATSKTPGLKKDISIEDIPVDKKVKKELRKMGVTSVDDLKQVENRNVDIQKASDNAIDFSQLANQIQKTRRGLMPPVVRSVSLSVDENQQPLLTVKGDNLAVNDKFKPVAVVNQQLAEVMSHSENEIRIALDKSHRIVGNNELVLTTDPFAVMKLNIKAKTLFMIPDNDKYRISSYDDLMANYYGNTEHKRRHKLRRHEQYGAFNDQWAYGEHQHETGYGHRKHRHHHDEKHPRHEHHGDHEHHHGDHGHHHDKDKPVTDEVVLAKSFDNGEILEQTPGQRSYDEYVIQASTEVYEEYCVPNGAPLSQSSSYQGNYYQGNNYQGNSYNGPGPINMPNIPTINLPNNLDLMDPMRSIMPGLSTPRGANYGGSNYGGYGGNYGGGGYDQGGYSSGGYGSGDPFGYTPPNNNQPYGNTPYNNAPYGSGAPYGPDSNNPYAFSAADQTTPANPNDAIPIAEIIPESTKSKLSEDDLISDMQSILSGESVFDPVTKRTIPKGQTSRQQGGPEASSPDQGRTNQQPSGQPTQDGPPMPGAKDEYAIFDKIAQSMQFANAYDMGTVELDNRFSDFDKFEELKKRKAASNGNGSSKENGASYGNGNATYSNAASDNAAQTDAAAPQAKAGSPEFLEDLDFIKSFSQDPPPSPDITESSPDTSAPKTDPFPTPNS